MLDGDIEDAFVVVVVVAGELEAFVVVAAAVVQAEVPSRKRYQNSTWCFSG